MGRDALVPKWDSTKERFIIYWKRECKPLLAAHDHDLKWVRKYNEKCLKDQFEQLEWRINMNLSVDNRAALGLIKEIKKTLDKLK